MRKLFRPAHLEHDLDREGQLLQQVVPEDVDHAVEHARDAPAEEGAAGERRRHLERRAEGRLQRRPDLRAARRRRERGRGEMSPLRWL